MKTNKSMYGGSAMSASSNNMGMGMQKSPSAPEKKIRAGAISATIWKNDVLEKPGTTFFSVVLERSYKDKEGNWQKTNSLRTMDVPKACVVLQKAYEYLVLSGQKNYEALSTNLDLNSNAAVEVEEIY